MSVNEIRIEMVLSILTSSFERNAYKKVDKN
jgi:hypothetical protein